MKKKKKKKENFRSKVRWARLSSTNVVLVKAQCCLSSWGVDFLLQVSDTRSVAKSRKHPRCSNVLVFALKMCKTPWNWPQRLFATQQNTHWDGGCCAVMFSEVHAREGSARWQCSDWARRSSTQLTYCTRIGFLGGRSELSSPWMHHVGRNCSFIYFTWLE